MDCLARSQADIIMFQEVGDHVTGDATLRKIVEERLALNVKAFSDGGYMTLVRHGMHKDVAHEGKPLFPDARQGQDGDAKKWWRQVQCLTLTLSCGGSSPTTKKIGLFNLHTVCGQESHSSGQNRTATDKIKKDAVTNVAIRAADFDINIICGDLNMNDPTKVAQAIGPGYMNLNTGKDYIISSKKVQRASVPVGKDYGGVSHAHNAVAAIVDITMSAAEATRAAATGVPRVTRLSGVPEAMDFFMSTATAAPSNTGTSATASVLTGTQPAPKAHNRTPPPTRQTTPHCPPPVRPPPGSEQAAPAGPPATPSLPCCPPPVRPPPGSEPAEPAAPAGPPATPSLPHCPPPQLGTEPAAPAGLPRMKSPPSKPPQGASAPGSAVGTP